MTTAAPYDEFSGNVSVSKRRARTPRRPATVPRLCVQGHLRLLVQADDDTEWSTFLYITHGSCNQCMSKQVLVVTLIFRMEACSGITYEAINLKFCLTSGPTHVPSLHVLLVDKSKQTLYRE